MKLMEGNTPLVRINSLSDALGVEILVSKLVRGRAMLNNLGQSRGRHTMHRHGEAHTTSFSIPEGPSKIE